ncbi:MAG: hypothetical protein E7B29_15860, partial [Mixta calida]|nr:hypothetical protein [Mixta calida]
VQILPGKKTLNSENSAVRRQMKFKFILLKRCDAVTAHSFSLKCEKIDHLYQEYSEQIVFPYAGSYQGKVTIRRSHLRDNKPVFCAVN